jgi:hypothetical protein
VGTASAEFGVVEAIDVVGDADQKLQVEGPVVTGLEGAEAVEDDGFRGGWRSQGFVEQQTVTPQSLDIPLDRRVPDIRGTGELTQSGAVDDAPEDDLQELRGSEPVVDGEGL